MYRYRVKAPGGTWSRWADWFTTPSAELIRSSRRRDIVPSRPVKKDRGR